MPPTALDIATLEASYNELAPAAYGLAVRILRDPDAAQDALQEAFIALWRNRERYDPERAPLRSLLMTIVHHKSIDIVRRRGMRIDRETRYANGLETTTDGPEPSVISADDARAVRAALLTLKPTHREVLERSYFGGLTCRQIAEDMAIPVGTVKSRMRTSLEHLAQALALLRTPSTVRTDTGRELPMAAG